MTQTNQGRKPKRLNVRVPGEIHRMLKIRAAESDSSIEATVIEACERLLAEPHRQKHEAA